MAQYYSIISYHIYAPYAIGLTQNLRKNPSISALYKPRSLMVYCAHRKIKGETVLKYCKELLAGILIGIGGITYLRTGDPLVSPFLFSVGLIAVVLTGSPLYTGRIGDFPLEKTGLARHIADYALMLLFNLLGAVLTGLAASELFGFAGMSMEAKLAQSPLKALALGFGCGMMMYLAVSGYKKTGKLILLSLPVATFIFCGFDHCIADAFYFAAAHTLPAWYYFPMVILGNTLGALFFKIVSSAQTN